jgi:DNA-binding NtrC family response regulator
VSRRILVVDDDPAMVETLSDILSLHGWDVIDAGSGEEAVDREKAGGVATVLMDIRMTGIDGVTAFRQMKARNPEVRVVLMTAHSAPDLLSAAEQDGVVGILRKPVDIVALLAVLGRPNGGRTVQTD